MENHFVLKFCLILFNLNIFVEVFTQNDFQTKSLNKTEAKQMSTDIPSDISSEKNITTNGLIESKRSIKLKRTNKYMESVPSSFAILVNFGIDGRQRILFSSNSGENQCGEKQIWDPFNERCRQIYCSTHFTLVDLNCVKNNDSDHTNGTEWEEPNLSFLDSNSNSVNITIGLNISKSLKDTTKWIQKQNILFETEFITEFTHSFGLFSTNRITNVTYFVPEYPNILYVNFLLNEDESSVSYKTNNDAILVVLSSNVYQRVLSFNLFDIKVNAFSIHTTIDRVKSFCNKDSEIPIWYSNQQFFMQKEDNLTLLCVNQTGRRYRPGKYLGNILYVQNLEENQTSDVNNISVSDRTQDRANVSSSAVVCETQTLIDESCPRILLNRSEYEWQESNSSDEITLLQIKGNQIHHRFELAPNGTVFVCINPQNQTQESIQDLVEDILSTVLIIISIIGLTCVLITYLTFESLRSTINGFNTINLSLCIEIMQILFLTNPFINNCRVGAIILHFVLLLSMSWSSVIAYDMYRTFVIRRFRTKRNNVRRIRFMYWFCANFCAIIVIIISIVSQIFGSVVDPDYGNLKYSTGCWIRNPLATFLFFGIPLIIHILVNFIFYLMTVFQVKTDLKTWKSLRKVTRIPSDSSNTSNSSKTSSDTTRSVSTISTGRSVSTSSASSLTLNSSPNSMIIFTRLGVLMGFTWSIALIIAVIPQKYYTLLKVLSYLFVILNTSQGVIIFIAFLCNRRVIKLWKNSLFV